MVIDGYYKEKFDPDKRPDDCSGCSRKSGQRDESTFDRCGYHSYYCSTAVQHACGASRNDWLPNERYFSEKFVEDFYYEKKMNKPIRRLARKIVSMIGL